MFPLSDDNEPLRFPIVTILLIAANVLVFLWELSLAPAAREAAFFQYGFVSAQFFGPGAAGGQPLPPSATILTSMFMHGGIAHLIGNMWFLWIFGDNVEGAMGRARFLLFYILCGAVAALSEGVVDPTSTTPLIGASGAISGVLGAYLLLYPAAMIRTAIILIVFIEIIYVPAAIVLGLWFIFQILSASVASGEPGGVAFWAHAGGFIAGVLLVAPFKRRDVALFSPPRSRAFLMRRLREDHVKGGGPWGRRR